MDNDLKTACVWDDIANDRRAECFKELSQKCIGCGHYVVEECIMILDVMMCLVCYDSWLREDLRESKLIDHFEYTKSNLSCLTKLLRQYESFASKYETFKQFMICRHCTAISACNKIQCCKKCWKLLSMYESAVRKTDDE